jgi:hypothetical protein
MLHKCLKQICYKRKNPPQFPGVRTPKRIQGVFLRSRLVAGLTEFPLPDKGFSTLAVVPNRVLAGQPYVTIAANHHRVEDQCFTGTGAYACLVLGFIKAESGLLLLKISNR